MMSTLVLNASFEPLSIVSVRRAITLIASGKAVSVNDSEQVLRYANGEFKAPYVIQRTTYAQVPFQKRMPFSRRWILIRDNFSCAYCGKYADTIDHVHPRALGGKNSYENCVAACKKCNNKKGSRTLESMGWTLSKEPKAPSPRMFLHHKMKANAHLRAIWEPYINIGQESYK